jgi:hypothetical protein
MLGFKGKGGDQRSMTRYMIFGKFLRKKRDTRGGWKNIDFYRDIICGWPLVLACPSKC